MFWQRDDKADALITSFIHKSKLAENLLLGTTRTLGIDLVIGIPTLVLAAGHRDFTSQNYVASELQQTTTTLWPIAHNMKATNATPKKCEIERHPKCVVSNKDWSQVQKGGVQQTKKTIKVRLKSNFEESTVFANKY